MRGGIFLGKMPLGLNLSVTVSYTHLGRDVKRVEAIVAAMRMEGVRLLDWAMDADLNRAVVTIAGSPAAVVEAAVRGVGKAAELIDLTRQQGAHPRIGAADVIPFVPISGIKLEQCVLLARQAGLEIWRRYNIPVYFYEAAAARPDRANLDEVRRGQFEGLRDQVRNDSTRRPDLGGPGLHPTAGACAVGARKFLVAYNIYFDSTEVALVRAIAREIRADVYKRQLPRAAAIRMAIRGCARRYWPRRPKTCRRRTSSGLFSAARASWRA